MATAKTTKKPAVTAKKPAPAAVEAAVDAVLAADTPPAANPNPSRSVELFGSDPDADFAAGLEGILAGAGKGDPLALALAALGANENKQKMTVNIAGTPGLRLPAWAVGSSGRMSLYDAFRMIDTMTPDQIGDLQDALFKARHYDPDYYQDGGPAVLAKDRRDPAFAKAFVAALVENGTDQGRSSLGESLARRQAAHKPLFEAEAKYRADAEARRAEDERNRAEDDRTRAENARRRAEDDAERAAKAGPERTQGTQQLTLKNPTEIGRDVDKIALELLGREATEEERSRIVARIQADEVGFQSQAADITAWNQALDDPWPRDGSVADPRMSAATAQPSAPGQSTMVAPGRMPGQAQVENPKTNPNAAAAFRHVWNWSGGTVGFLGIVGDEAHKKRTSDHNDWNAVDIGTTSEAQRKAVAAEMTTQAGAFNVKYVIEGDRIWKPDGKGWRPYNGEFHNHVHTSFLRGPTPGTPAPTGGPPQAKTAGQAPDFDALAEALTASEGGRNVDNESGSSASGFFQITDAAWGGFKGYKRAKDAPRDVQKQKAELILRQNYAKHGDPELAVLAYYLGPNTPKAKLEAARTSTTNPTPGRYANMAPKTYLERVMAAYKPDTAAPTAGAPGVSRGRGVDPYPGATTTAHGANVLPVAAPDPDGVIRADLEAANPAEAGAWKMVPFYDVYARLWGGGR